jgi:hypothetical protein
VVEVVLEQTAQGELPEHHLVCRHCHPACVVNTKKEPASVYHKEGQQFLLPLAHIVTQVH